MLETIEIPTGQNPVASIIWMHGLGADNRDFVPVVPELDLAGLPDIRFIFPNAGTMAVTINNGYVMRSWYDILERQIDGREDEAGLRASERKIAELIEQEHQRGIPYERIILAGFSQGAAMSLQTGLRFPQRLGGLICLSGYLPLRSLLAKEAAAANRQTPIFMAHGTADPVVTIDRNLVGYETLTSQGYLLQYHKYPMQHSLCAEEIVDISAFIRAVLGTH